MFHLQMRKIGLELNVLNFWMLFSTNVWESEVWNPLFFRELGLVFVEVLDDHRFVK